MIYKILFLKLKIIDEAMAKFKKFIVGF